MIFAAALRRTVLTADTSALLDLTPLTPDAYAKGHALFEARSTQRAQLTAWLLDRLALRGLSGEPVRVLSVGCGDGTVDAVLARALPRGTWTGVEPHGPSADAFLAAVPGATVLRSTFDRAVLPALYDVVLFVHSLYYVGDVGRALARATSALRPGGELLVLQAPREGLNQLASGAVGQWWAEDTGAAVAASGLESWSQRVDGVLDLTDAPDEVLDFTVQAQLTTESRARVLDVLRSLALPGPGLRLAHPLRGWVLRVSG